MAASGLTTLLIRAAEAAERGLWKEAETAYREALAVDSEQVQALAGLAGVLDRGGKPAEAKKLYQRSLELDPGVPETWCSLGNLLLRTGAPGEAEHAFRNAVNISELFAPAWYGLGIVLQDKGELAEACACFTKAISLAPDFAQGHLRLGDLLLDMDQPETALQHFDRYRQIEPEDWHVCLSMVDALASLEAFGEAITLLKTALKAEPDSTKFLLPLAHLLPLTGRHEEAVQCWDRLLQINPQSLEAHLHLGTLLFRQKAYARALQHLRQAVALQPSNFDANVQLGFSLAELGQAGAARAIAERLLSLHPQAELAHFLEGFVAVQQARIKEGLEAYQRAGEANPGSTLGISNVCQASMYADFLTAEAVSDLHRTMSRRLTGLAAVPDLPAQKHWHGRRIRVGYMSPDFRSHPVGFFLEPILNNHDHGAFEIFGYGIGAEPDATGRGLIAQLDHWRHCVADSDTDLVKLIRDDQLDILVDAGGYTANGRMNVLASRAAAIQVSYLAYPCTSGMARMDYIIGDQNLMPADSANLYSEKQAKLDTSFLCFVPRPGTPGVAPLPASRNAYITFGSFNNLSKISGRCVHLWARVLDAVSGSHLVLKAQTLLDSGTRELIWRRFESQGIDRQRVLLQGPTLPVEVFLEAYANVDIALDSVPYNGGTTSCDALWMGVPVVSLAGRHFFERMGSSILHALGRPEWIAASEDSFVDIATSLASDVTRLRDIRESLREQMRCSPLCDSVAITRNMEKLFRAMLRERPAG